MIFVVAEGALWWVCLGVLGWLGGGGRCWGAGGMGVYAPAFCCSSERE